MKRMRGLALLLALIMVFAAFPITSSAASSKPGKVKITSIKAGSVSKSTNTTTITIKWKRVSNATGYEIYEKNTDGKWVRLKKLGKNYIGLKISNVSAGQSSFKVRAVNKSKKGSFTKKSIFVKSPLKLEQVCIINGEDTNYEENGIQVAIRKNVISLTGETSSQYGSKEEALQDINSSQAAAKKEYLKMIKNFRLQLGVKGVSVKETYLWNGSEIYSKTYKE